MNFTDLIWEIPNSIPDDLCDSLVKAFEDTPQKHHQGLIGKGVDLDIKVSTDFSLSLSDYNDLDNEVFEIVNKQCLEYNEFEARCFWPGEEYVQDRCNRFTSDTGYQIQKTVKDGFYKWHHDYYINPVVDTVPINFVDDNWPDIGTKERIFTFLYYLTDDFEGGRTQFHFNGEIHSVIPEKGKGLWFPSTQYYVHRGETVTSGEKYIMTGWIYDHQMRKSTGTFGYSKYLRDFYGEDNMVFPYNPKI